MKIGCDTGFLISLGQSTDFMATHATRVVTGSDQWIFSTLSLNEFLVYSYKRSLKAEAQELLDLLAKLEHVELVPVTRAIAIKSASYRHGLGLATIDSLMLATFSESDCEVMYTTDAHFDIAQRQNIIRVVKI